MQKQKRPFQTGSAILGRPHKKGRPLPASLTKYNVCIGLIAP